MLDRANRALWLFLGLAGVAVGAWGLATANGVGGLPRLPSPSEALQTISATLGGQPTLWWSLVTAGLVIVALVSLWLAARQLLRRRNRLGTVALRDDDDGRTAIEPVGVARAAARDIGSHPRVVGASVRITRMRPAPTMDVRVRTSEGADLDRVRAHVEDAFGRVRSVLEAERLDARIVLEPTGGSGRRVR